MRPVLYVAMSLTVSLLLAGGCVRLGPEIQLRGPDDPEVARALDEAREPYLDGTCALPDGEGAVQMEAGEAIRTWNLESFDEDDGAAFDQMSPNPDCVVPLLLNGEVIGTMEMHWTDAGWSYAGSGGTIALSITRSSQLLRDALGPDTEVRAVTGPYHYWAMGRTGDREAAVFFSSRLPEFAPTSLDTLPDPERVYSGEDLRRYLNAIGE